MTTEELKSLIQRLNSALTDKDGEGTFSWRITVSSLMEELIARWNEGKND